MVVFLPISAGLVKHSSTMFFTWETVTRKSVVSGYPQQTNKKAQTGRWLAEATPSPCSNVALCPSFGVVSVRDNGT